MPIQACNIFHIMVTESAANTLTFKKLETGISVAEKVAWNIHRLAYFFPGAILSSVFNTDADALRISLTASSSISDIEDQSNPAILDHVYIRRVDLGTAASGMFVMQPFEKDLSGLPGGGLLVPPMPLYLAVVGSNLASAVTVRVRGYYTQVDMKTEDYWQLLEMYRVVSS